MTLTPGSRLAHYEIVALLGFGGMGEVYRATDTSLKRQVAIKVLPVSVATDPERLARFRREAEILAALNHPNIAHIHGLETSDGTVALLMELVEGPTLADRIAQGPIPIDEALPIAKQIAEALEAAHERHIVHRDLKPANIKVREDGTVKVLDFGLAKAAGTSEAGAHLRSDVAASPTITSPATHAGVILGTAAYMSPEQAKGRPVDKRADIWAFGCVLYEMLSGKRPFAGEDVSDTLANVLKSHLEWQYLPRTSPVALSRLLRRCLDKDPRRRLRDIGEARLVIDDLLAGKSDEPSPGTRSLPGAGDAWWSKWVIAGLCAVAAAAVTGLAVWYARPSPARVVKRFAVTLPEGHSFSATGRRFIALSPDATRLVYAANGQLYIRAMNQFGATALDGTTGATSPFFSPDGQWVGFWQTGQLKKLAITGGSPVVLCAALNPYGVSWERDGSILFGQGTAGISRVSDGGGTPSVVITVSTAKGEVAYGPELLPDRKTILFSVASSNAEQARTWNGWNDAQIVMQAAGSADRTVVVRGGSEAHYIPSGHLVYVREGRLLAIPFDPGRGVATGNPVSMVESVRNPSAALGLTAGGLGATTGAGDFAISTTGLLAYVEEAPPAGSQTRAVVWVDRQGHESMIPGLPPRAYVYPRLSPDGKRVAIDIRDQDQDIWVFDLERETLTRRTFEKAAEVAPLWTPDGQRIVFFRAAQGLVSQPADGSGSPESLTTSGVNFHVPATFTKDGQGLLFDEQTPTSGDYTLKMLALEGRHISDVLTEPKLSHVNAAMSPDGRWLAYQAGPGDRPNASDVFVRPFPNVDGGKWQISTNGGTRPVWSRNGRELFYLAPGVAADPSDRGADAPDTMMAVAVDTTTTFRPGTPAKLFSGRYLTQLVGVTYDVSPDGQRFLMVKRSPPASAASARILVVDNWIEELKARVPVQ